MGKKSDNKITWRTWETFIWIIWFNSIRDFEGRFNDCGRYFNKSRTRIHHKEWDGDRGIGHFDEKDKNNIFAHKRKNTFNNSTGGIDVIEREEGKGGWEIEEDVNKGKYGKDFELRVRLIIFVNNSDLLFKVCLVLSKLFNIKLVWFFHMFFNHYWPFFIYLPTNPICFICYSLFIGVFTKTLFHSVKVLTNVRGNYYSLVIVPLTFPCSMHFSIFPWSFVFMTFAWINPLTFNQVVLELAFVISSISVLNFAKSTLFSI